MRLHVKKTGLAIALTLVGGVLVLSSACRAPTQVTLDVTYGGKCSEIGGVAFIVGTDPHVAESRVATNVFTTTAGRGRCVDGVDGAPSRIGTLVVTPNDDTDRASVIVLASFGQPVEACKAATGYFGCIVARRVFAFVEHKGLTLGVSLDPDCKNVPCDAISTCRKGTCVSSGVECNGDDCGRPGVAEDGGDITVDAPTSSDAVVQPRDGDPPIDAPVIDGPADAGRCEKPKSPLVCSTINPVTTECAANEQCCAAYETGGSSGSTGGSGSSGASGSSGGGGGIKYGCRASCTVIDSSHPIVRCTSAKSCPQDQVCCLSPYPGMGTSCALTCTGGGSSGSTGSTGSSGGYQLQQVCLDDCECENGGTCSANLSIGLDPPQPLKTCAQ